MKNIFDFSHVQSVRAWALMHSGKMAGKIVARCWTKEDMQTIVRAVNAHEELLEIARYAADVVSCGHKGDRGCLHCKASAAIVKLEVI